MKVGSFVGCNAEVGIDRLSETHQDTWQDDSEKDERGTYEPPRQKTSANISAASPILINKQVKEKVQHHCNRGKWKNSTYLQSIESKQGASEANQTNKTKLHQEYRVLNRRVAPGVGG